MNSLKKQKKTVKIDIETIWTFSNGLFVEIEETDVLGSLYAVGDGSFILAFDTFLNKKRITHTIKIIGESVFHVQLGDTHTRRTFKRNEQYANQTFYGGDSLVTRNLAKAVDYSLTAEGGILTVEFEQYSDNTFLGYCKWELFIR